MLDFNVKRIPVRPHIRRFMLADFEHTEGVLSVHQNTWLGRLLLLVMEKSPYRLPAPHLQRGDVMLEVRLPSKLKHYHITDDSLHRLGDFLEKEFQQRMLDFVKGRVSVTQNERDAINTFYKNYQLDTEEYDPELCRKIWRDYKNKLLGSYQKKVA